MKFAFSPPSSLSIIQFLITPRGNRWLHVRDENPYLYIWGRLIFLCVLIRIHDDGDEGGPFENDDWRLLLGFELLLNLLFSSRRCSC